ncbi:MAG: fructose-1,6-bisphosphatase/inositol monophosphatase family enzyme [Verrucomicrobiales bacterium]|jgi:fructose-1,6-bisphosphatase/inositol monophosphatase family enzyme
MKLSESKLEQLLQTAIAAAKRAGAHIQSEAGKPREVISKEGHTPASQVVTEVDFESQRLILETLADSMEKFGLGLLTEEAEDDDSRQRCDYFWCIDPIDGTLPFIENVAGYSVSIGLTSRAGEAVIGVVFDPVTGNLYHASRGGGAFRNREPIVLGDGGKLTLVIDRSMALLENWESVRQQMAAIAVELGLAGLKVINQGGAAMNACWVIENAPAVYFKMPKPQHGGGALWDFAATACLFAELGGGVVCDFDTAPLKLNREGSPYMNREGVIFASSEALAAAVRGLSR